MFWLMISDWIVISDLVRSDRDIILNLKDEFHNQSYRLIKKIYELNYPRSSYGEKIR